MMKKLTLFVAFLAYLSIGMIICQSAISADTQDTLIQQEKKSNVRKNSINSLNYMVGTGSTIQGYYLYTIDGKVSLKRSLDDTNNIYVHPKILDQLADWFEHYNIDQWVGFQGRKPQEKTSTAVTLIIVLNSGQMITAYGDLNRHNALPNNFYDAEKVLVNIIEKAMSNNSKDKNPKIPEDKLQYLLWNISSMPSGQIYEFYWRLDPEGFVPLLRRKRGENLIERKLCMNEFLDLDNRLKQHDIGRWNGFSESDTSVLDGHGFNLKANLTLNKKVEAYGYMRFPKRYQEASKDIIGYLESILAK